MSKIKNDGLDQYGAERFKQQHFGITGIEGVNAFCAGQTVISRQQYSGWALVRRSAF